MSTLFAASAVTAGKKGNGKRRKRVEQQKEREGLGERAEGDGRSDKPIAIEEGDAQGSAGENTFAACGMCDWVQESCRAMGFRKPTPVQRQCIPAILQGRDVMGCAVTGSGKTAAFALPILQELSRDPFGIFALILTPTRELAIQISEQFAALGAAMSLRQAVVIGGQSMLHQSLELAQQPHIVIATPGRLRDHLQGSSPPQLGACRFLVLDEADRLLARAFESELRCVQEALTTQRQTLLFSATLTPNLEELRKLAVSKPLLFDLTLQLAVPAGLKQEYVFMPARIKLCWLVQILRAMVKLRLEASQSAGKGKPVKPLGNSKKAMAAAAAAAVAGEASDEEESGEDSLHLARSIIIFVGSCKACQELLETLTQLGVGSCVCLHSILSQPRRLASLGKFKSSQANILIATDVASRGLDLPEVDLVINYDIPRVATDYVHRVGRTARAGRKGRALSFVTQYDVELVHSVEEYTGTKLELCEHVVEKDVLPLLNTVSKASRVAKMRLLDQGFEEALAQREDRRRNRKRKKLAQSS